VEISALDRRAPDLPRTATGKIQRFKLRQMEG
jgi:acyl-coenzyme A synthetase/AMP-(fatty) acid ligase